MFDEEISHHKKLFTGPSLMLGKIHWIIQTANHELEKKLIQRHGHNVMSETLTELGKDVGLDAISWWVFKKELDVEELLKKTEATLLHAQKLKDNAQNLKKRYYADSYLHLIEELKKFTDSHKQEIENLHDYALGLHDEDVLAPSILFSYRVWGHTRRSWLTVKPGLYVSGDEKSAWAVSTEFATGLRSEFGYTIEDEYSEIYSGIAESIDDEYQGAISVPRERLLLQTSHTVLDNLAIYLENIRESLRNIILEIEKYKMPEGLLTRESFWRSFIAWTMMGKRIEDQLWDLKETLEMFHAKDAKTKTRSEVDFCENVAGYANTQGGIMVLGVTNEHPRKVVGVADLENRMKFLNSILVKYINHKIDFIHFQQVVMKDEKTTNQSCLVIAVAQTKDVICVRNEEGRFSYPIRAATGLDRSEYEKVNKSKEDVIRDNFQFLSPLTSLMSAH